MVAEAEETAKPSEGEISDQREQLAEAQREEFLLMKAKVARIKRLNEKRKREEELAEELEGNARVMLSQICAI